MADRPQASSSGRVVGGLAIVSQPLDHSRVTDSRVQDWMSLSGTRRTLPTNVNDTPVGLINVNTLKFERKQAYAQARPQDGGRAYTPSTCVDNWVEDRRDALYRSGTHPKELHTGRLFQTDYSDNFRPSSEDYMDRVKTLYGTAKFPQSAGTKRAHSSGALGDFSGSHVYYSRAGFGSEPQQDHTPESRRGAFWVGTAAHRPLESIATSSAKQQPLEFQGRCSTQDGESMLLLKTKPLTYTDASTQRATGELVRSQRWTKNWETTHKADFIRQPLR